MMLSWIFVQFQCINSSSSASFLWFVFPPQYLQVNSRDKQSEMKSSRSLGDLKGSLLKGSERVRKHSTGEVLMQNCGFCLIRNVVRCDFFFNRFTRGGMNTQRRGSAGDIMAGFCWCRGFWSLRVGCRCRFTTQSGAVVIGMLMMGRGTCFVPDRKNKNANWTGKWQFCQSDMTGHGKDKCLSSYQTAAMLKNDQKVLILLLTIRTGDRILCFNNRLTSANTVV